MPDNEANICLLYTSDAADERSSVDLGGRRIIKKKNKEDDDGMCIVNKNRIYTQYISQTNQIEPLYDSHTEK